MNPLSAPAPAERLPSRVGRWLVPRTLFGRIVLIIVIGIAGSQLVSIFLSLREYQRGGTEFFLSMASDRLIAFTSLFDSLRPQDRERIAQAMSRPPFLIDSIAQPTETRAVDREWAVDAYRLQTDLQTRLGPPYQVLVGRAGKEIATEMLAKADFSRFRPERGNHGHGGGLIERSFLPGKIPLSSHDEDLWSQITQRLRRFVQLSPPPSEMEATLQRSMEADAATVPLIQIRLTDGTWLRFYSLSPMRVFAISPLLIFNWVLLLLAALVVSVIAAQLVIRPLRGLAEAADRVSQDLDAEPLADSGPVEVRAAAQAFNRMRDRLANYLNSRARMLMAMSHDLKTPLTRLRLRSELLEEGEVSERIKADLAEMESLVMSTLDYLRGGQSGEAMVALDVRALVAAICEDHPQWRDAVSVTAGAAAVAQARPLLMRRALSNLIDNAVRYGGRAEVSFAEGVGGALTIGIHDYGPGIAEQYHLDVFKPFFRIEDSRNRATGGTGLGLAIAKEIIEAQGGQIRLANRRDGLDVTVLLPA